MTLLAACTAPAFGREWYVSPTGTDGAEGTLDKPTSLAWATTNAAAGDTVILRGGRYETSRQVFLEKEKQTLTNYPAERPVIVGPVTNEKFQAVLWLSAAGCKATGIEIEGGGTYSVKIDAPDCVLRDCRVHGSGRDCIKIARPADRCLIENCEIFDSGKRDDSNAEGIDNVACDDTIVRNCYIHHVATNGVYMKGGAANCLIEGNVVTDCGDNGIMFGQSTDREFMTRWPYECVDSAGRGNFVTRTQGAGLAFEAALRCRFEDNTVYDVALRNHAGVSVHENSHHTPSRDVEFLNNIIIVLTGKPTVAVHVNGLASMADMKCDRNLYHNPNHPCTFAWDPERKLFDGLAAWQKSTPFDANSHCPGPPATQRDR